MLCGPGQVEVYDSFNVTLNSMYCLNSSQAYWQHLYAVLRGYQSVALFKPYTSRETSGEFYVVARGWTQTRQLTSGDRTFGNRAWAAIHEFSTWVIMRRAHILSSPTRIREEARLPPFPADLTKAPSTAACLFYTLNTVHPKHLVCRNITTNAKNNQLSILKEPVLQQKGVLIVEPLLSHLHAHWLGVLILPYTPITN